MKILKITVLLLLVIVLAGCGKEQPQAETTVPTTVTAPSETEPTYIPSLTEQAKQDGIAVETPYITLYYPKQWRELKSAEVAEDGKNCRITFRTTVADREVELFSMVIGPEVSQGYLLGTLDGMYVYSQMNEQDPGDWSEEDYSDLCRQQEYINELILQLHENTAFVAA